MTQSPLSPDYRTIAYAKIDCCFDLIERLPMRSWLKRILSVLCREFKAILPDIEPEKQEAAATQVSAFVVDAIIEKPERERFEVTFDDLLSDMEEDGGIGKDGLGRLRKKVK